METTHTFKKVNSLRDIKNDPRVSSIHREEDFAFSGKYSYWLYLKPGWQWDSNQQHTIHERTIKEVCRELNHGVTEWDDDPDLKQTE